MDFAFFSAPVFVLSFLALYFQLLLLITILEKKPNPSSDILKIDSKNLANLPSITIAIPVLNEEKTLAKTLDSLLKINYPKDKLKIIVVNDGSTDKTKEVMRSYQKHPQITLLHKENGGKHTAVNLALSQSQSELFGCLDADSFAEPNALIYLAQEFADQGVDAVVPSIIFKTERETVLEKAQRIEYLAGQFIRQAFHFLNAIQVTPGPLSLFRRKIFSELGPYKHGHLTEDFELALRLQKNHKKIIFAPKAIVYTHGPKKYLALHHQRLRWSYGFLRNIIDYRKLLFNPKYGHLGLFTLPANISIIFLILYTALLGLFNFVSYCFEKINYLKTHGLLEWDGFYFSLSPLLLISFCLIGLFLYGANYGASLVRERARVLDIVFYLSLYIFIVPAFLFHASGKLLFGQKVNWR